MNRSVMTHDEFLNRKKVYSSNYTHKKVYMALWRKKNKKKIKAYEKRYRKTHKDEIRALNKAWIKKNWRSKVRPDMATPENRFKSSRRRARYLGREWNISLSDYREFLSKRCHYCDGSLNQFGTGLDRLNNDKGYVIGNVVPCCGGCNRMRGRIFTSEEMKVAMTAIRNYRLSKISEEIIK